MSDRVAALTAALADRYLLERELGAGGMATVYLAQDLKHDRKVALKVLKPELAAVLGGERFVVEIKTTAALQHPHILPLFDSGTADGFLYYVMPWIQGETLRSKLDRETQLGIEEAVRITREVADALDYAHRHGVIHRDIKPENILLHDGRPMVADFGIALALSAAAGGRMTETGLSLGTPHYMSPEQATAEKELTARSDIYSLGCVLYEMLTGNPPHTGATAQQIIMKIVTEEASPVTKLRKSVPVNVAAAVSKAVERLPADRFESAKAFADALGNPGFTAAGTAAVPGGNRGEPGAGVSRRTFLGVAGLAALLLIAAAWGWLRPVPAEPIRRLSVAFPEGQPLGAPSDFRVTLSPDGTRAVYVGARASPGGPARLWLRDWTELNATPIPGTEGAFNPAFSPDGRRIAFIAGAPRTVRVVSLEGGLPVSITDSLVDRGGMSWGHDGYIYVDGHLAGDGLMRVKESGGSPEVVTTPDTAAGEIYHVAPEPLPSTKGLLFSAVKRGAAVFDMDIAVFDFKTRKHKVLVRGVMCRYSPTGHLLYVTADGTLMAAPFDQNKLVLTGEGVAVATGVSVRGTSRVDLAVGGNGTLLYTAGAAEGGGNWELVWVARDGVATSVDTTFTGQLSIPRISPDGRRVAITRLEAGRWALWVKDLDRGPPAKLYDDGGRSAAWTPDGKSIVFVPIAGGEIWTAAADGSALPKLWRREAGRLASVSYAWDGNSIVFSSLADLFAARMKGDTARQALVEGPGSDIYPALSPDGRWLAYTSDESGRWEIYLRPFPDAGTAKRQVSTTGGFESRWSHDGRELFYMDNSGRLVAVPVGPGPVPILGAPKPLFPIEPYLRNGGLLSYDVAPDGKRFLMARPLGINRPNSDELIVVENFFQVLKTKVKR